MNIRIKPHDYVLDMNHDMLTVRREKDKKPIVEIISFEDTDEILVNTKKEFIWLKEVVDIEFEFEVKAIIIHYLIENDNTTDVKTIIVEN